MRNGTVPDSDKKILSNLLATLTSERADMYNSAAISAAIANLDSGRRNLLTKIEFLTQEPTTRPRYLRYKELTVVCAEVKKEFAISAIQELVNDGLLHIPNFDKIPLEGNFFQSFSPDRAWLYRSEWSRWPGLLVYFDPSDQFRTMPSFDTLVARDAPYYKDLSHLLKDQFGIRTSNAHGYLSGRVVIVVPDFRARISDITIASRSLKIDVQSEFSEPGGLLAKLYAENDERVLLQANLPMVGLSIEQPLADQPTVVSVAILSNSSGEPIDHKTLHLSAQINDPEVTLESPELAIGQMLLIGESETIEFREKIDNSIRLAKTVCAFANTKGGTIVVGVNDEHAVIGCKLAGMSDHITNVVRSHCDPPPNYGVKPVEHEGKHIMLIRVAASENVIHTVREHGPYIRANGTTRTPVSFELEQLYRRRFGGGVASPYLSDPE